MKRIAFLGPAGTVSEESARCFFGEQELEYVAYKQISEVFLATATGKTDLSVIPIENAIDGSVSLHLDLLVNEFKLPMQAEWVYPSIQNLIGVPNAVSDGDNPYSHIDKVYSHPVAMAQCLRFLRTYMPNVELENVSSTAQGVRLVQQHYAEGRQGHVAAIGTRLASDRYALTRLAENITDHDNNYTRFVAVGFHPPVLRASEHKKTTILVTLPEDYTGALHQVLSAFAWRRLNLSKIESRPTKQRLGSYYFYIDVESDLESILLPSALEELQAIGCQVRILGSYPSYTYESLQVEG